MLRKKVIDNLTFNTQPTYDLRVRPKKKQKKKTFHNFIQGKWEEVNHSKPERRNGLHEKLLSKETGKHD